MEITKIAELIISGTMGAIGSMAQYFYKNLQKEIKFVMTIFLINIFLGFFIGMMVSSWIPEYIPGRDGFIFLSGFLVYQLLDLLERKGIKFIPARQLNDK